MMISESDRVSLCFHSDTPNEWGADTSWFMQDFCQSIVPLSVSGGRNIECTFKPIDEDFINVLKEMLPSQQRHHRESLNRSVLATIRYVANHLVRNGSIVFEFVTLKDKTGKKVYKLESVPGQVEAISKGIIQTIPYDAAEKLNISNTVIIPKDKCFIISFPESLGGDESYLKFLEEFKSLSNQNPLMGFTNNSLKQQAGYDNIEHQRLHELELWKKSRIFNWHHRKDYSKEFSGYYHYYRRLHFRKAQIILRDSIIEQLKYVISAIAVRLGTKTELRIEGLTSLNTIEEMLKQWEKGEVSTSDIIEVLYQ